MIYLYLWMGIWVLLGLTILFASLAEIRKSWIMMLISCLISLPNVIFILVTPLSLFMHLWVIWFFIQIMRCISIYKKIKWNKLRVLQVCLWGIAVLLLAYNLCTRLPYSVNKSYSGTIYKGTQVVKRAVPVKVNGKVYRGIFYTNRFVGQVQIEGTTYFVHTTHLRRSMDGTKRAYPYLGNDRQSYSAPTITLKMSGDFNSILAYSEVLAKKYGRQTELKGSVIKNKNKTKMPGTLSF